MLDQETKRKIDSARDILVGKVPDPKAQVEQITIALMYKFMEDMDKASKKLGGKSRFFTKDFEKYSWSYLLDPRTGGFDRINLYSEALVKMSQNPALPQLFRDIFKGAFLPYRDPETLNLFLKEINSFQYDHSERLGDSFEYLLSVLGSQGEAGQFRTPRHIIDFMVEIMSPKKDETVLDPACGTAGFLISAYKHILKNNMKKNPGDKLTPAEKEKIMNHFTGYDISPDMVRLSRVNMYLHGFQTPYIYEYDTLTSEDKWQETADVILANPPFMTPKGGIRPHKRFSVQANRSEVLFVDYMAEHLNVNGRAGIIVPEGIIFQSSNAYKALRKMLIENYLYAVVSLPAGVFNPYAGVKTSILLLDKTIAKKTKDILFVKIENDGYDLGAQRRSIDKNNIPEALKIIKKYQESITKNTVIASEAKQSPCCLLVPKQKIFDSGDYNLSGDRYKETVVIINHKWPMIMVEESLNDVKYSEKIKKSEYLDSGKYPIIDQSEKYIAGYCNKEESVLRIKKPVVLFGDHTRIFKYIDFDFVLGADGIKILEPKDSLNPKFYYYMLKNLEIKNLGYSRHFKELKRAKIPLPSLEIQQQIVTELDGYQNIIIGAKQVVENWKPKIDIDPKWKKVKLEDITKVITKGSTPTTNGYKFEDKGINFIKVESISENGSVDFSKLFFISLECHEFLKRSQLESNDILFSIAGTEMGISAIIPADILPANINQALAIIRLKSGIDSNFVLTYLRSVNIKQQIENIKVGVAQFNLSLKQVSDIEIPLPPLEIQKKIVKKIEAEHMLVESAKKLVEIYKQKIKDEIGKT